MSVTGLHICVGGPSLFIDVNGKRFYFENHPIFGPFILNTNGSIAANQPGQRHLFWHAFRAWQQQGSTISDGVCIWREPTPMKVKRVAPRTCVVVEYGEPGGKVIVVEDETGVTK